MSNVYPDNDFFIIVVLPYSILIHWPNISYLVFVNQQNVPIMHAPRTKNEWVGRDAEW